MQDLEPALTSGLRYARSGDLATLTLDTPDSPVNILTDSMAAALLFSLSRAVDEGARALLLRSAKPRSFLNGARLLAAATVRTEAEARAGASALRQVYAALAASPLTTIAVVEGSCFGCGMELSLCCDHRLASASSCAQFYMTELPDYLITPVFGSTQRLPPLVGLTGAAEMLLWGRRVRGRGARRIGLADATLGIGTEEKDLARFVARLRRAGFRKVARVPRQPEPAERQAEAARIAALPSAVQPLFRRCLSLMEMPFERGYTLAAGLEAELAGFGEMVLAPRARQAIAYFFVRQTARAVMAGSAASGLPASLTVTIDAAPSLAWLRRRIAARPTRGLVVRKRSTAGALRFRPAGAGTPEAGAVLVCGEGELPPLDRMALRLLAPGQSEPACELSLPAGTKPPPGLVELLELLDVTPVATRPAPGSTWIGERLLAAWWRPIANFLSAGGTLDEANRALFAFGFSLLPGSLAKVVGKRTARWLLDGEAVDGARRRRAPSIERETGVPATTTSTVAGEPSRRSGLLVEEVLASLGAEASACVAERGVAHASQIDVLARALFGFPLWEGSLLRNRAQAKSARSSAG